MSDAIYAPRSDTGGATVYLLTIAKGGSRMMTSAVTGRQRGIYRKGPGQAWGYGATAEMLARGLAGMTDHGDR
ncbi:MAG TPA: hypothetical protein VGM43_00995 [Bryobacteraceae bacterium]|jgi:hypothetical protein